MTCHAAGRQACLPPERLIPPGSRTRAGANIIGHIFNSDYFEDWKIFGKADQRLQIKQRTKRGGASIVEQVRRTSK